MKQITVVYCITGKPTERKTISSEELNVLLSGVESCVGVDIGNWSSELRAVEFRLKDGRYLSLSEENESSWEGSSNGWINVTVSDESSVKYYED